MTETVKEKPAFDPSLLPEDELEGQPGFRETLEDPRSEEDKAIMDGDIKQQQEAPEEQSNEDDQWFGRQGLKAYRKFAQLDTYYLEMRNGSTVKYTGMFPSGQDFEDLEDMRIQIIAGCTLDYRTDDDGKVISGKRYNIVEQHQLQALWLDKLAETYLYNTKTKKPMTPQERRDCKYDHEIKAILKSKLKRSNNDVGPVGKN